MEPIVLFSIQFTLSLAAYALIGFWYVRPRLARLSTAQALVPLLWVHAFRVIGGTILAPGSVDPAVPMAFRVMIGYGDMVPAADPRTPIAPDTPEPIWLEPFPDEWLPEAALGLEARYTMRESITLAFLAAMQLLPPRQRVILILCDVLDWHAREVAQVLDITVAAVNGLLRRARATMHASYHEIQVARAIDRPIRAPLNRYVEAWESGDVDLLVALLADKVVFTMPPSPTWYGGRAAVRQHAEMMFSRQTPYRFRLQPARSNNQIAFACYRGLAGEATYHAHALQVLTLDGDRIAAMDMFLLPALFPHFGLASQISR